MGGRSVYGHVITKVSRMGSLPHFFTQGAPLRESSAINSGKTRITQSDKKIVRILRMLNHKLPRINMTVQLMNFIRECIRVNKT